MQFIKMILLICPINYPTHTITNKTREKSFQRNTAFRIACRFSKFIKVLNPIYQDGFTSYSEIWCLSLKLRQSLNLCKDYLSVAILVTPSQTKCCHQQSFVVVGCRMCIIENNLQSITVTCYGLPSVIQFCVWFQSFKIFF